MAKHCDVPVSPEKTYGYRERNELQRQEFFDQLSEVDPTQVIYIDEAECDYTDDYPYGYCHHSERFYALRLGHRIHRISMIARWSQGSVLALMTFERYCNTVVFEAWVEQMLVPSLELWPSSSDGECQFPQISQDQRVD